MYIFNVWETQDENSWFSCIPGKNGFLPIDSPLCRLPDEYNIINDILDNMKINKSNGELGYLDKGYLDKGCLGEKIEKDLPIYNLDNITDIKLLAALHRDYCFLASAYSLETCHRSLSISNNNEYGKARDNLPPQLSLPLSIDALLDGY